MYTHSPPPAVGKQAQLPLPFQKSEAEWFGAGLCLRRPLLEGEAPPVGKTADQVKPGDTSSSSGEAVKSSLEATRRPNIPKVVGQATGTMPGVPATSDLTKDMLTITLLW